MACRDGRNPVMEPFFNPRGVAVIGARRSPGFGYFLPLALRRQGWGDRVFLVNPAGGEVHGMPLRRSLREVEGEVDLAVLIVPAQRVPEAMREAGERGIRNVVIESAGFAETGDGGRALQEKVKEVAAHYGIRVMGPNCLGVINTANRFSTMEVVEEALVPGPLAVVAQSGVFGSILLDALHRMGLFVSKAVTLGNRVDINECDVLEYLLGDEATEVVMMYLEGTADGRRLRRVLEEFRGVKPVLVLKSGRTPAGKEAALSHTGSMAGEDALYDALFAQTGALRFSTLEDMLRAAEAFVSQPSPRGGRLAIVTTSGSLGAMAADAAVAEGLEVPPLSPSTVEEMRRGAPGWMNVRNPLDVGPSGLLPKGLRAVMEDPAVDMVLGIAVMPYAVFREFKAMGATAGGLLGDIRRLRAEFPEKPLALCSLGEAEMVEGIKEAAGGEVPVFTSPEAGVKALSSLWRFAAGPTAGFRVPVQERE